jgi:hypothetical protein
VGSNLGQVGPDLGQEGSDLGQEVFGEVCVGDPLQVGWVWVVPIAPLLVLDLGQTGPDLAT